MSGLGIDKTIKPVEIPSGNQSAGIGYITIPDLDEIDRDQFVEDCYRSHTVSIFGGVHYGYFHNIAVDSEVIKHIKFPKKKGEHGSPVVWLNIAPWNKPVIVGLLKYEEDYYLNDEGEYNLSREYEGNHIDFSAKAKKGTVDLNIVANKGATSKMRINMISSDNSSEFALYVKGKVKLHATEEVKIVSDKKLILHVVDSESKDKVVITYEAAKGFSYIDEFKNEINIKDGLIEVKSDKINHSDGKEPMVLGDTLADLLGQLIDEITKVTVPTAVGPSGTPMNTPAFQAIKQKIDSIKSKISNLS